MTSNLLSGFYLSPVQAITTSDWGAILAISKMMAMANLNLKHHESSFSFFASGQEHSLPQLYKFWFPISSKKANVFQ